MTLGQRLSIWTATLMVVAVVALAGWRQMPPLAELHLSLRQPVLPLPPDPSLRFTPGRDGGPILLVVIENSPEARPQAGLADACLVFAMATEARITRFAAAHCESVPPAAGPVRSARSYMLEIARDLGAVLVHSGQSNEAFEMIRTRGLPVVNEFWTPGPFWRDGSRRAPHNLYTDVSRVRAVVREKAVAVLPRGLPYRMDPGRASALERAGIPALEVSLGYGPLYDVVYRYDSAQHRYLRAQHQRPHMDASGVQVSAATVLTMFVPWRDELVNGAPSSRIDYNGQGRLVIAAAGRAVEGTWERQSPGHLALKDDQGATLVLPPGPVWVELLPKDSVFEVRGTATRVAAPVVEQRRP
jgi:hypothetical protein